MSYYAHPIFGHRVPSPTQSPPAVPVPTPYYTVNVPHHGQGYDEFLGHRQHPSPYHHNHHHHQHRRPSPAPYATPHHTGGYDLEEEERAALAHLRQIQQRREAEQASIRHEALIRARVAEQREAAIRQAMVQAHKEREEAVAKAIQERAREQAVAAREQQQIAAIRSALEQRRQIEAHRERQQVARALVQAGQQQEAERRQAAIAVHQAQQQQQQHQQQLVQMAERKNEYVKRCAAKCARGAAQSVAKEVKKEYKDEYEAINNVLGNLFGINLSEVLGEGEKVKEEVRPTATAPAPVAPATIPTNKQEFPEDINDLLSHFLGLRIEPTTEDATKPENANSTPAPANNEVPRGLNGFLSRYGLVFEPVDINKEIQPESSTPTADKPTAQSVSAADPPEPTLPTPVPASSTAAASSSKVNKVENDEHPLTTFLNGFADLPPFVRDILGNVEMAFKEEGDKTSQQEKVAEEVKGKGKGVAEGEKKERVVEPTSVPAPAPIPAPAASAVPQSSSTEIEAEPTEVDSTSTALSTLSNISSELDLVRQSFDFPSTLSFASSSTPDSPPALLFNKTNSGYHAQTHKLLQLLLAADAITSNGNKDVRRKRKEVVREVEREIEGLEKRRDEVWEEVKSQRENGDEGEVEEAGSSRASSVVDHTEVREDYVEEDKSEEVREVKDEDKVEEKVDAKETEVTVEENKETKVDKDEGYELV